MKKGFTLAEALITLTLIGVIATLTIPGIIANNQEHACRAGLRKAVTALNQAIAANIALEGENAANNKDLYRYLKRHMSVANAANVGQYEQDFNNAVFYTEDGMKYEFSRENVIRGQEKSGWDGTTYESRNSDPSINNGNELTPCFGAGPEENGSGGCGGCGSRGLVAHPEYNKRPCIIVVDVNGDRDPNPTEGEQIYALPSPGGKKLTDLFTIMITENKAVPYGEYAQRMMYKKN